MTKSDCGSKRRHQIRSSDTKRCPIPRFASTTSDASSTWKLTKDIDVLGVYFMFDWKVTESIAII